MAWFTLVLVLLVGGLAHPTSADASKPRPASTTTSASASTEQTERVLDYDVHIRVDEKGALHVRERIRVRVETGSIRSGFTRSVRNQLRDGRVWRDVDLTLEGVLRDGQEEYAEVRPMGRVTHIQIGAPKTNFESGVRTWELRYRVAAQMDDARHYDELHWSVAGDNWRLPIDAIRATVEFPEGASIIETDRELYRRDGNETEGQLYGHEGNIVVFESPRALLPSEELRVHVKIRKGTINHATEASDAGTHSESESEDPADPAPPSNDTPNTPPDTPR